MVVSTNNPVVSADPDYDTAPMDLRGLVMSGGKPYILLTLEDPETGGVDVSHVGIDPEVIPAALREVADLLDA